MGLCYFDMGDYEKALPLFQKELEILIDTLPAKHDYIIEAQEIIEKITNQ